MNRPLLVHLAVLCLLAKVTFAAQWQPDEMNPGKIQPAREFGGFIVPDCDGTPCGYNVHFFMRQQYDPNRKTILYIPGGPGQIVSRANPDLKNFESIFNVVYFDIRGSGLSSPNHPVDSTTDRFLRAKFVLKDIDAIRRKVIPEDKPWDAIYGHSAGTVLAQLYAKEFGVNKVKRLILSAPISRQIDNEPHRSAMIVSNFKNILQNNTDPDCPWKRTPADNSVARFTAIFMARSKLATQLGLQRLGLFGKHLFRENTNNFCFVDATRIASIAKTLSAKLDSAMAYGSIALAAETHKSLAENDTAFASTFRYPVLFFHAVKRLELLGSPRLKLANLPTEIRSAQVDAALVLGYILSMSTEGQQDAPSPNCNPRTGFLDTLVPSIAEMYCERFTDATATAAVQEENRSDRTATVLGITAGVHRWPFNVMGVSQREVCLSAKRVVAFAREPPNPKNRTAKELLQKIGFESNSAICNWDPAEHRGHTVPGLIIKGGADPVIHGCQAEYFFNQGLPGSQSIFLEIPDAGHAWLSAVNPETEADLQNLLKRFVELPIEQFAAAREVKQNIARLGAMNRTPRSNTVLGCQN